VKSVGFTPIYNHTPQTLRLTPFIVFFRQPTKRNFYFGLFIVFAIYFPLHSIYSVDSSQFGVHERPSVCLIQADSRVNKQEDLLAVFVRIPFCILRENDVAQQSSRVHAKITPSYMYPRIPVFAQQESVHLFDDR